MNVKMNPIEAPAQRTRTRIRSTATIAALSLVLLAAPIGLRHEAGSGGLFGLMEVAAAVQWNEMPMPEGSADLTRSFDRPYRTDTIDIPLGANDGDLEYKLNMRAGDAVVYSWRVLEIDNPDWFYSEFHGHTEPDAEGVGDLMFYRKETGSADNGYFVAPFEGIHGWYLQNQSENPVVVRLEVAGFYEVIPDQVPASAPE